MDWSNWIYLAVGLVIGALIGSLFASSKSVSRKLVSSSENISLKDFLPNQDEVQKLLEEIKHSALAYNLATEMSQFKAGFLARTTHVLRSPLNGLIGLHQLILSDLCENPEEEREFIAQAHERALKLLKLIDEILNVARVERGTNRINIQPQPLSELLQETHDLTYMLAENRNYPFEIVLPESEIYVLTDNRWLRQVLINLIETTVATMETQMEEGRISICATGDTTSKYAYIWLDVPAYAFPDTEAVDLMTVEVKQQTALAEPVSPGMKLLLGITVLEVLGGKLEIVPYPNSSTTQPTIRLQISIPLALPETVLAHAAN